MAAEHSEELDVDGSEGFEVSTGVLHEEYIEEEEEYEEEEEAQGSDHPQQETQKQEQVHTATSASSSSDSDEGDNASTSSDEEQEDDLFGPQNEDYMRTTARSPFPIPTLPPLPRNGRGGRGSNHRGDDRFNRREERLTECSSASPFAAGQSSGYRVRDMLVAEMKLSAVGHQDETLRISCPFQEPREIACYSRTAEGQVHYNDTCLRELQRDIFRRHEIDLNEGYEYFVEKKEELEANALHALLGCVRNTKIQLGDIHFVTFRNNLNKILGAAYNRRDPWEMGVHKRRGTVYLDVHKLQEPPPTDMQRRMCYWGYKFEQVATERYTEPSVLDSLENGDYTRRVPAVDANVEFCSVVRTKLGPHRIIIGAEIDCYDVGSDGTRRYTELKTSRVVDPRTVERFEREKLLKFWIQSYVAGVPRIVCGYRDDNGRLMRVEMMHTQEIAHRMKHKHYWEGGVCLAFADRILCWLYGSVKDDGDYVLRFLPSQSGKLELWKDNCCPPALSEHLEELGK